MDRAGCFSSTSQVFFDPSTTKDKRYANVSNLSFVASGVAGRLNNDKELAVERRTRSTTISRQKEDNRTTGNTPKTGAAGRIKRRGGKIGDVGNEGERDAIRQPCRTTRRWR